MRNFRPETSGTQYRIVELYWTEIQRIWMQRRVLLTYCGQTPTMKSRWKSTKGTRRVINTGSKNLGQMQFLRQLREQTEKMFTVTWNRNFHRKSAALLCLCNGAVLAKFNLSLDFFGQGAPVQSWKFTSHWRLLTVWAVEVKKQQKLMESWIISFQTSPKKSTSQGTNSQPTFQTGKGETLRAFKQVL